MKTTVLLLGAIIATCSFTALAGTGAQSLKPVAPASVSLPTVTSLAYVDRSANVLQTPRAQASQGRILKGTDTAANDTLACAKTMSGGPKAIQACTEHPATMPGCQSLGMK